jgi:hypothetical protein
MVAEAAAVLLVLGVAGGASMVTWGAIYPEPWLLTVMDVTMPPTTVAVAVASAAPTWGFGSVIVTAGTVV